MNLTSFHVFRRNCSCCYFITFMNSHGLIEQSIVCLFLFMTIKVQSSIQGDELRIVGKKRDDLQETIKLVKNLNLKFPLQYVNFRD